MGVDTRAREYPEGIGDRLYIWDGRFDWEINTLTLNGLNIVNSAIIG